MSSPHHGKRRGCKKHGKKNRNSYDGFYGHCFLLIGLKKFGDSYQSFFLCRGIAQAVPIEFTIIVFYGVI